jgi:E3 ubiquitin-protein ligase RNF115/126
LPTDVTNTGSGGRNLPEAAVGLTIWRLAGGGFAVGTFRGVEREQLPVVFTEMDGGFNTGGGMPRRISWAPSGRRSRESGESGLGRAFRGFVSFLGWIRPRRSSIRRSQAWDVADSRW